VPVGGIRLPLPGEREQLRQVGGHADEIEVLVGGDEARDALAQQHVVLGKGNPDHGNTTFMSETVVVGTPQSTREHPRRFKAVILRSWYAIREHRHVIVLDPV
jgi:hypothetical protein